MNYRELQATIKNYVQSFRPHFLMCDLPQEVFNASQVPLNSKKEDLLAAYNVIQGWMQGQYCELPIEVANNAAESDRVEPELDLDRADTLVANTWYYGGDDAGKPNAPYYLKGDLEAMRSSGLHTDRHTATFSVVQGVACSVTPECTPEGLKMVSEGWQKQVTNEVELYTEAMATEDDELMAGVVLDEYYFDIVDLSNAKYKVEDDMNYLVKVWYCELQGNNREAKVYRDMWDELNPENPCLVDADAEAKNLPLELRYDHPLDGRATHLCCYLEDKYESDNYGHFYKIDWYAKAYCWGQSCDLGDRVEDYEANFGWGCNKELKEVFTSVQYQPKTESLPVKLFNETYILLSSKKAVQVYRGIWHGLAITLQLVWLFLQLTWHWSKVVAKLTLKAYKVATSPQAIAKYDQVLTTLLLGCCDFADWASYRWTLVWNWLDASLALVLGLFQQPKPQITRYFLD